mmetsp:Transcript_55521/g.162237  ORF Transcript_55521/g.162237 Transcript_55521/m.162237 type:complete len:246 (+) Transcript_55521:191-928(+)
MPWARRPHMAAAAAPAPSAPLRAASWLRASSRPSGGRGCGLKSPTACTRQAASRCIPTVSGSGRWSCTASWTRISSSAASRRWTTSPRRLRPRSSSGVWGPSWRGEARRSWSQPSGDRDSQAGSPPSRPSTSQGSCGARPARSASTSHQLKRRGRLRPSWLLPWQATRGRRGAPGIQAPCRGRPCCVCSHTCRFRATASWRTWGCHRVRWWRKRWQFWPRRRRFRRSRRLWSLSWRPCKTSPTRF